MIKQSKNIPYVFLLLFAVVFTACNDQDFPSIEEVDKTSVQEYIQKSGLSMQEYNNTGIMYQLVAPGTGNNLDFTRQVPAIMTVKSLDGKFQATDTLAFYNRTYTFLGYLQPNDPYRTLIAKETIPELIKAVMVKEGGTIRMIVPSRLAYGKGEITSVVGYTDAEIPGNSSLDITIKIIKSDKIAQYADDTIVSYLQRSNLTGFTRTSNGIYYKIGTPGTGSPITADSVITAEYTRRLLDGKVYETATAANPMKDIKLTNLVIGWSEIIPLIKEGGTIRFILPYNKAYGISASTSPPIPAFLNMDFDVKITDVKDK